MRYRLVRFHEYFRIILVAVWDTVKRVERELVKEIEPLVPKEDDILITDVCGTLVFSQGYTHMGT